MFLIRDYRFKHLKPEYIEYYGYPSEVHQVTTEDGYIITVHRIPKMKNTLKRKTPVLLAHGLLSSSRDWVVSGPGKALAFLLADKGYDVFMMNSRGNTYSKNHTTLKVDSDEFWQFSFHEIGIYDLPAVIDYILRITKQEKLYYIGHSQGTSQFYVLCSQRPEYNRKIKAHFSLAPVAFMSHIFNPFVQGFVRSNNARDGINVSLFFCDTFTRCDQKIG